MNPTLHLSVPEIAKALEVQPNALYKVIKDFPQCFINKDRFCFAVGSRPAINVKDYMPRKTKPDFSDQDDTDLWITVASAPEWEELERRGYDIPQKTRAKK